MGLALAEIGEILDLYEVGDGGAQQAAKSLRKFWRSASWRWKIRRSTSASRSNCLKAGCADSMEQRTAETRPDLLPRAADYDQMLRRRLDGAEHSEAK